MCANANTYKAFIMEPSEMMVRLHSSYLLPWRTALSRLWKPICLPKVAPKQKQSKQECGEDGKKSFHFQLKCQKNKTCLQNKNISAEMTMCMHLCGPKCMSWDRVVNPVSFFIPLSSSNHQLPSWEDEHNNNPETLKYSFSGMLTAAGLKSHWETYISFLPVNMQLCIFFLLFPF